MLDRLEGGMNNGQQPDNNPIDDDGISDESIPELLNNEEQEDNINNMATDQPKLNPVQKTYFLIGKTEKMTNEDIDALDLIEGNTLPTNEPTQVADETENRPSNKPGNNKHAKKKV